jgi:hypothetical protein
MKAYVYHVKLGQYIVYLSNGVKHFKVKTYGSKKNAEDHAAQINSAIFNPLGLNSR